MKHALKLFFFTLILICAINVAFSQKHTHRIKLKLDKKTGELLDPGTTVVHRGDLVEWKIKWSEKIHSFGIEGRTIPFPSGLPNDDHYTLISRFVNQQAPYDSHKYIIHYRLESDSESKALDPKIAVRPKVATFLTALEIVLSLALLITLSTSIFFYRKWQGAKAELAQTNQPKV